jgi:hypothetical protein
MTPAVTRAAAYAELRPQRWGAGPAAQGELEL